MSEAGLPPLPDLEGDRGALARAVSRVEAGGDEARTLLDAAWKKTGRARRIGLTGPPGAGKSTLLATLVPLLRGEGKTVGVVAVDPSSPYTGGALLGDRHRMARSAADDGVFVRSVASRGAAGGFGNLLKIRHARGYVSYYGHLSRFVSGLRVGQEIEQKQLIGYVGDTGLATGPHVCYRIARDGRYVDPTTVGVSGGQPVAPSSRYAFYRTRDAILSNLVGGSLLSATQEAL